MRFTNLSSIRAALALVLLVLIGGAFAVVGQGGIGSALAAPTTTVTTTSTTTPTAVGMAAGELAAQSQQVESSISVSALDATGGSRTLAAAGLSPESTTTVDEAAATTTVPESTTSEVETTTTTTASTTTSTEPPVTTTTVPETTTTTTTVPETTTTVVETTTTTSPPSGGVLSESEAREIFALYFAAEDVERALEVAICESGLNTAAYNPAGYAGLFQHGIAFWDSRAESAGWAGASVYDAHANSAVAAWLVYSSGWQHWPNC